jgi:hypothetical protein
MRLGFAVPLLLECGSLGLVACGGAEFTAAPAPLLDGGGQESGGPSVDAGTGPFCAPDAGYDFCSDFDEKPLPDSWNNDNNSGGGAGTEDPGGSVSAPNSFLAIAPALASVNGGTQPVARAILTALNLPKGQTHLAFDLRIDELSFPNASDPNASVVTVAYTQGPSYTLALEFHPAAGNLAPFAAGLLESTSGLDAGAPTLKLTPLPGVLTSAGVWYQVKVDFTIDLATNPGAVPAQVSVTSGSPPTTVTKLVTLSPPLGTTLGGRTLSVGVQSTAAVGEAKVRFDNVTYKH